MMERLYNVPLRKEAMKSPIHSRAKRATKALKQFLAKHMKSENIKLSGPVNERIWERGIRKPPHHIKVKAVKDDDGLVRVDLADAPVKEPAKKSTASKAKAPKEPKQGKSTEQTTHRSDSEEARAAKAPVPTVPAEETAVKAPEPRPNESPDSSQGTKNQ